MPITGFLKIPDIPGESRRVDHEDEIDVFDIVWGLERSSSATVGRGRARSRTEARPLVVQKFYDRASPYLALAVRQGKSFDEMVLSVRKDSGEAHLDYLIITMENVTISRYEFHTGDDGAVAGMISEVCELEFEKVTIKYTVQADDHSSGDEHEVRMDLR